MTNNSLSYLIIFMSWAPHTILKVYIYNLDVYFKVYFVNILETSFIFVVTVNNSDVHLVNNDNGNFIEKHTVTCQKFKYNFTLFQVYRAISDKYYTPYSKKSLFNILEIAVIKYRVVLKGNYTH